MKLDNKEKDALDYLEFGQTGKIEVVPTIVLSSQLNLALAYSPGIAVPGKAIEKTKMMLTDIPPKERFA